MIGAAFCVLCGRDAKGHRVVHPDGGKILAMCERCDAKARSKTEVDLNPKESDMMRQCVNCGKTHNKWEEISKGSVGCPECFWLQPSEVGISAEKTPESDPNGIDQHAPGAKCDLGKHEVDFILKHCLGALAGGNAVMRYGEVKYTEGGFKKVPEGERRYFNALVRHAVAMMQGEERDPESGLLHEDHLVTNAVFISTLRKEARCPKE